MVSKFHPPNWNTKFSLKKLKLDEQVNVLFESWLFEECEDTIHTSEQHYEAAHDEEYQIMFLKFVKESLLQ